MSEVDLRAPGVVDRPITERDRAIAAARRIIRHQAGTDAAVVAAYLLRQLGLTERDE